MGTYYPEAVESSCAFDSGDSVSQIRGAVS
jgi:hypothetical protein